ncbi:PulJ/GspJ family protein [Kineococcus sp. SYSU DK003]|uniref:PulJ/GspJ family protein n=1 Tax=Kineococcus sp. SYSU DK003 TaxID=3383124 RepID=UPI003D7D2BE7
MRGIVAAVRRRAVGGRDAGLTLVEMVVSMGVGALLLALVTGFTVRQVRTIDYAEKRNTASSQMATAQDAIAQQTRTMVASLKLSPLSDASGNRINGPVVATADTLGFYSYLTSSTASATALPPVQEVWLWVGTSADGSRQLCSQTRARTRSASDTSRLTTASPDLSQVGNRTCRVLVQNLATVSSSNPVFRYVTEAYDPLSGVPTSTVLVASPATDSSTLRGVHVTLRVDAGTGTHPVVLEKAQLVQLLNKIGKSS